MAHFESLGDPLRGKNITDVVKKKPDGSVSFEGMPVDFDPMAWGTEALDKIPLGWNSENSELFNDFMIITKEKEEEERPEPEVLLKPESKPEPGRKSKPKSKPKQEVRLKPEETRTVRMSGGSPR